MVCGFEGFDGGVVRFGDAGEGVTGFDEINRPAGCVGRVNRRGGFFHCNRTRLHGEAVLGNGLPGGRRGGGFGGRGLRRGQPGGSLRGSDFRFFTHATFNEETDDDRNAEDDRANDGFFESFAAAVFNIQFKTGRNLKRVLSAHVLL